MATDLVDSPRAAIVTEATARRYHHEAIARDLLHGVA